MTPVVEAKPAAAAPVVAAPVAPRPAPTPVVAAQPPVLAPVATAVDTASDVIPAGPAIRRFAREVGVDLTGVVGTGEGGRITREDVLAVVRQTSSRFERRLHRFRMRPRLVPLRASIHRFTMNMVQYTSKN